MKITNIKKNQKIKNQTRKIRIKKWNKIIKIWFKKNDLLTIQLILFNRRDHYQHGRWLYSIFFPVTNQRKKREEKASLARDESTENPRWRPGGRQVTRRRCQPHVTSGSPPRQWRRDLITEAPPPVFKKLRRPCTGPQSLRTSQPVRTCVCQRPWSSWRPFYFSLASI